jgi:hypothetical protein
LDTPDVQSLQDAILASTKDYFSTQTFYTDETQKTSRTTLPSTTLNSTCFIYSQDIFKGFLHFKAFQHNFPFKIYNFLHEMLKLLTSSIRHSSCPFDCITMSSTKKKLEKWNRKMIKCIRHPNYRKINEARVNRHINNKQKDITTQGQ